MFTLIRMLLRTYGHMHNYLRYYCRGIFERKRSDQLLVINKGVWKNWSIYRNSVVNTEQVNEDITAFTRQQWHTILGELVCSEG